MNGRHRLHLVIGHFPMMGVFIGIALLGWGLATRSSDVSRASLGVFILSAVATAVTVATGEAAKDGVLGLPGVNRESIERHAAAGKLAAVPSYFLGAVSLAGLVWAERLGMGAGPYVVVLVLALLAWVMLARASQAGGSIRHTELAPKPALGRQSP